MPAELGYRTSKTPNWPYFAGSVKHEMAKMTKWQSQLEENNSTLFGLNSAQVTLNNTDSTVISSQ